MLSFLWHARIGESRAALWGDEKKEHLIFISAIRGADKETQNQLVVLVRPELDFFAVWYIGGFLSFP